MSKQEVSSEKTPQNDDALTARALRWVREHPTIKQSGISAIERGGLALPDALATDPKQLVAAGDAIVQKVKDLGAPSEVVVSLEQSLTKMKAGAASLGRYQYAVKTLKSIQGLRDRFELEPVLEKALAGAPDEGNREKIEKMLGVIRRPPGIDLLELGPLAPVNISCDWKCCAFACIMCEAGCVVCCAVACLVC